MYIKFDFFKINIFYLIVICKVRYGCKKNILRIKWLVLC